MIIGLVGSLLTGGISLAKEYLGGKNEEKRLKLKNAQDQIKNEGVVRKAAAEAKAKAMLTRLDGDIKWENIWAQGAQKSLKDEFWTGILASPFILLLIPAYFSVATDPGSAATAINAAFDQMAEIPTYWTAATGTAIGAAFGVRKVQDFFSAKKGV